MMLRILAFAWLFIATVVVFAFCICAASTSAKCDSTGPEANPEEIVH